MAGKDEAAGAAGDVMLDWNESPLGPPEAAVDRVLAAAHQLHRYPRGLMEEVAGLAAGYLDIDPAQVLLTSGVDEAIDITMGLVDDGWALHPGFDFHERVRACGKPFHAIGLGPDWQPAGSLEALGARSALFIAQPGNPTGNLVGAEWLEQARKRAGYFFRDETYQEFCSEPSVLEQPLADDRILVYRSFAKAFGLAGVRVGCLIGRSALIAELAPRRRFMPIDAVSLNAAAGVLMEPGFVGRLAGHVLDARPALVDLLRGTGLFSEVRDTETNFVVARPRAGSDALVRALAVQHVRVKACDVFGLEGWVRIGVGSWDALDQLAAALAAVRPQLAGAVG
jgi:histidinol-phosphate/aromatic aminotransferase/cobyric acid decarboxylase-like protein